MHSRTMYVWILVLLAAPAFAGSLQFQNADVVATGLTPNARVAWFGATLTPLGYEVSSDRVAVITVADAAGTAVYHGPDGIPTRSVWAAVDLTTGAYVTGKPAGSPAKIQELDQRSFTAPGRLEHHLLPGRSFRELLLARPGASAWTLSVGDGGASDEDEALDGRIVSSASQFQPVEQGTPAPDRFKPEDTVIAIEPFQLEMLVARVAR